MDHTLSSTDASSHKDNYSIGITILEILVGTDIVLSATTECHLEKMFQDCCSYLDAATQTLLGYLIFERGHINLKDYMVLASENDGQMISD
jgi:hypothetical protein